MTQEIDTTQSFLSGVSLTQFLRKGPQDASSLGTYLDTLKNCWLNPDKTNIHQSSLTILDIFFNNLLQTCTKGQVDAWEIQSNPESFIWCIHSEIWDIVLSILNWDDLDANESFSNGIGPHGEIELERMKLCLNKHHLMLPILGAIKFINYSLGQNIEQLDSLIGLAQKIDHVLKAYFQWMDLNNMSLPKTSPFYNLSKQPHIDLVNYQIANLVIALKNADKLSESSLGLILSLADSGFQLLTKMVKWEEHYKSIFTSVVENLLNPIIELYFYLSTNQNDNTKEFQIKLKHYLQQVLFPADQLNGYRHAIEKEADHSEPSYHETLFETISKNIASNPADLGDKTRALRFGSIQSLPLWLDLFCRDPSSHKEHIHATKIALAFKLIKMADPFLDLSTLLKSYKIDEDHPKKKSKRADDANSEVLSYQFECVRLCINACSSIVELIREQNLFANTLGTPQLVDRETLMGNFVDKIKQIQIACISPNSIYTLSNPEALPKYCLDSCLICYSKLIDLNPMLLDNNLKALWDLSLSPSPLHFQGSLQLGLALINNYARIRKLDQCIAKLVESLKTNSITAQSNPDVLIFNTEFIDQFFTILNTHISIYQLDSILSPIMEELIPRLAYAQSSKYSENDNESYRFHIVSQLTQLFTTLTVSFDRFLILQHLSSHFHKLIDSVFLPQFEWDSKSLKSEEQCKKKLDSLFKKLNDIERTRSKQIEFISTLQLLSMTMTLCPELMVQYISVPHLFNLIYSINQRINIRTPSFETILVFKVLLQFCDLLQSEFTPRRDGIDAWTFKVTALVVNQLSAHSKGERTTESTIVPHLVNTINPITFSDAIWSQVSNRAGWSAVYAGLVTAKESDHLIQLINHLARSILHRQLDSVNQSNHFDAFIDYQLEGDHLGEVWLQNWLDLTLEGLLFFKDDFLNQFIQTESQLKFKKLDWIQLDATESLSPIDIQKKFKALKLSKKLSHLDQINFLNRIFNLLMRFPPELISNDFRLKLFNLVNLCTHYIFHLGDHLPTQSDEVVQFVKILIDIYVHVIRVTDFTDLILNQRYDWYQTLFHNILPILNQLNDFSEWISLRQNLKLIMVTTVAKCLEASQEEDAPMNEYIIQLVQPDEAGKFSKDGQLTWGEIYKQDLMTSVYTHLTSNFISLFSTDLPRISPKVISKYFVDKGFPSEAWLEADIASHHKLLSDLCSSNRSSFDLSNGETPTGKDAHFIRATISIDQYLQRLLLAYFINSNPVILSNQITQLRDSKLLDTFVSQLIVSLIKNNESDNQKAKDLVFQTVLNAIQWKVVVYSIDTKFLPMEQLDTISKWLQIVYYKANSTELSSRLVQQMRKLGVIVGKMMDYTQIQTNVNCLLEGIVPTNSNSHLTILQLLSDWLLEDTFNKRNVKVKSIRVALNHLYSVILSSPQSSDKSNEFTLASLDFIHKSIGIAHYQLDTDLISGVMLFLQQYLNLPSCSTDEAHLINRIIIRLNKFHFKLVQPTLMAKCLQRLILQWIQTFDKRQLSRVDIVISPLLTSLPLKLTSNSTSKPYQIMVCNLLTELIQLRLEYSQCFTRTNQNNVNDIVLNQNYLNLNATSEWEGWFHLFQILETFNPTNSTKAKDDDLSLKIILGWISPPGQNLLKMVRKLYVEGVKFRGKV